MSAIATNCYDCRERNEDYNGWGNRETWAVCLLLGNDQDLYNRALSFAREHDNKVTDTQAREYVEAWTDRMWEYLTGERTTGRSYREECARYLSDIGSLWRVHWVEVAAWFNELDS